MNLKNVVARQKDYEGFRPVPYKCTAGVWTIGYGQTRHNGHPVTSFTPMVTKVAAEVALKASILDAIINCQRLYLNWKALTDVQQEVLVHMCFQLGLGGLRKFKKMNRAVANHDVSAWVVEMRDSKWYKQTPRVALRLVDAISADKWADKAA